MSLNINRTGTVYLNMRDPKFMRQYYRFKTIDMIKSNEIYGSSPPDIFIGRMGYPNVYVGPLVPPSLSDTSEMGTPETWTNKTMSEIVELRSMLIRGMYKTKVTNADNGKIEEMLKEMAIADKHTTVDLTLKNIPSMRMSFNESSQPFGPSAQLKDMRIDNSRSNAKIENAYLDTDMGASSAIVELYEKGVLVSKIQKALSAGVLGRGENRRLVPTRWSITATDDTLSKHLLEPIKSYNNIDSIRIYENYSLDNRWLIIFVPGSWEYESMEAWYPNTTWNASGTDVEIGASYEPYDGRKTYAEIGGCYYAARLAVSELLEKIKVQAKVIILREVHSGYIMPVGVWNVREHVREALRSTPKTMANISETFSYVSKKMEIPIGTWIKNSRLLKNLLYQKRLS